MEEEAKRFGNFFSAFSRLLFGKNPSESRIAYPLFARKKGEPRVASAVFRGLESAYVVFYSEYRAMRWELGASVSVSASIRSHVTETKAANFS